MDTKYLILDGGSEGQVIKSFIAQSPDRVVTILFVDFLLEAIGAGDLP